MERPSRQLMNLARKGINKPHFGKVVSDVYHLYDNRETRISQILTVRGKRKGEFSRGWYLTKDGKRTLDINKAVAYFHPTKGKSNI